MSEHFEQFQESAPSSLEGTVLFDVFDILPSGLMLLNANGDIFQINQRGRMLLALDDSVKITHVRDLPQYLEPLRAMLLEAHQEMHRAELALQLPSRPNERSTLGFSLSILDGKKNGSVPKADMLACTFSDITQVLKDRQAMDKIKDELHQSKKLASIGTMISGVAHELNNPLTGISMSAELSRMNLERLLQSLNRDESSCEQIALKLEKTLQEVTKITKACQKAAALVGELLSYAKPSQLVGLQTDYVHFVEEVLQTFKSHPDFGRFQMKVLPWEGDVPLTVLMDRVKIEQVFYNLCKNACDAAEGEGTLVVSFSVETPGVGEVYAIAHVRDNGPGIDKTILTRIFDPFFSTKGNKGVGLGLSIAYRTVEQHGGLLSVDNHPEGGTEFKVSLPLVSGYIAKN